MAAVLNKTTLQYLESVNTPDFMDGSWIINPDISTVINLPPQYWIIDGETVRAATTEEQTNIDLLLPFQGMTIDQAKSYVSDQINVVREAKLTSGIIYKSKLFDSDARARANISGLSAAIANGVTIPDGFAWRSHDNTNVPMTSVELITMGTGMMFYTSMVYSAAWSYKDTLDNRTGMTLTDVANYDYSVYWPSQSIDGTSAS